jgi:hypothetical protein
MHVIRRLLCAAAVAVVADGAAASTTNLTFNGFESGSRNVKIDARIAGSDNDIAAAAGTFSVTGDNPVETFIAWCIDISTWLHAKGTSRTYARQDVLSAGQTARLQRLFDAAYDDDVLSTKTKSAAFQVAIWDSIYDDDWNAQTKGGDLDNFFRVVDGYNSGDVQTQANLYLTAAMSYGGGKDLGTDPVRRPRQRHPEPGDRLLHAPARRRASAGQRLRRRGAGAPPPAALRDRRPGLTARPGLGAATVPGPGPQVGLARLRSQGHDLPRRSDFSKLTASCVRHPALSRPAGRGVAAPPASSAPSSPRGPSRPPDPEARPRPARRLER